VAAALYQVIALPFLFWSDQFIAAAPFQEKLLYVLATAVFQVKLL
jgi:hypothetical protein